MFQIHLSKYGMPFLLIRGEKSDLNKKVKNADFLGYVLFPSIDVLCFIYIYIYIYIYLKGTYAILKRSQ